MLNTSELMVPSLVLKDELLLRYAYFVGTPPLLEIMGCNGNEYALF